MSKLVFYGIAFLLILFTLNSCQGQLSKEQAERILIKAYKKDDHPEADGGRQTTINYLLLTAFISTQILPGYITG